MGAGAEGGLETPFFACHCKSKNAHTARNCFRDRIDVKCSRSLVDILLYLIGRGFLQKLRCFTNSLRWVPASPRCLTAHSLHRLTRHALPLMRTVRQSAAKFKLAYLGHLGLKFEGCSQRVNIQNFPAWFGNASTDSDCSVSDSKSASLLRLRSSEDQPVHAVAQIASVGLVAPFEFSNGAAGVARL